MKDSPNYYYSITKRMLLFAGQWPYQGRKSRIFRISFITVITFSITVPQIGKIIQCDGNEQCIMLVIPSCCMIAMVLVKLYTCQFNSSKIKSFFDYLHSDWMKLECAEEHEIMETYAKRANLISLIYCLYYYISGAVFISISLVPHIANLVLPVNESWPIFMPYEAYYFVDGEKYFFYIFFHILVSLEICIAGVMAHDCMLLTFIEHICSVFAVAGFRFGDLVRNDSDHVEKNRLNDKYNRKIAVSVHAHWQALHLAEFLERTFRVALAIQVLIVTLALSITLLQIVLRLNEIAEVVRYTAYVISQVINLLCISVQSQKLMDHSVQIRDKVYNSSWYKLPTKSQKMLLSVMRRSLQPNFLSAGKIYVFSLKSFTTVIQSSMSYFTVLASFQ